MSLVNDMLRDLEARRDSAGDAVPFAGLRAADEQASQRRARLAVGRKALMMAVAAVIVGVPVGLLLQPAPVPEAVPVSAPVPTAAPAAASASPATTEDLIVEATGIDTPAEPSTARLLAVLPQNDGQRFALQLLIDQPVSYQRSDGDARVTFRLNEVTLAGEAMQGQVEREGVQLRWQIEPLGEQVRLVLEGEGLQVQDRLEAAGDRWQLWIEVPLVARADEEPLDVAHLPVAESVDEPALPAWATREAPTEASTSTPEQTIEPEGDAPAVAEPVTERGPADIHIVAHQPDALARARQALAAQDYPRAIAELTALRDSQPDNPEAARWLARAHLADGRVGELLTWLPAALARRPHDLELRALLARGQLQAGDAQGAVATLRERAPQASEAPDYLALQAAIHQQLGEWAESAALYQRLVSLRPGEPVWRLGLAIALEQLDRPGEAASHYRLALRGQGLDGSTRRYAEDRLAALAAVSGEMP